MIDDSQASFPLTSDQYEIRAGLRPLRGNVFHIAAAFDRYRKNKLAARAERLDKYFQLSNLDPDVRRRVQSFIIDRLASEQSDRFKTESDANGQTLICAHTGDRLRFSAAGDFLHADTKAQPNYTDGLDALAMQIEDDLVVVHRSGGNDRAVAIHLCTPNHWSAEQNIGRPFEAIHTPVADIEPINRNAKNWIDVMIQATGGLQRIAWGIATDDELNRHPQSPPGSAAPRRFDPEQPRAFLRVEQQVMFGFPEVQAFIFAIHTTFRDCCSIREDAVQRERLIKNIRSMSPATLKYKGLDRYSGELIRWLEAPRD